MRIFSLIILLGLLISCNNSNQLCDCIEAGDEVNRISASFFNRPATQAGKDSLTQAKIIRDEICAPFQEMMPQELHEKARECQTLNFSTDE